MRNFGFLSVAVTLLFCCGCAGLRQFPDVASDQDKALRELDIGYERTLAQIYGPDGAATPIATPAQQKQIRNKFIETRMAVIDAQFQNFQAGLVKENVRTDFGIALLGIGVGAAGALAAETMSQILSAVSGGLAGTQAAYGKSVLYDKAMSALLAQMQASRKTIAGRIFERWPLDIDKYPLWLARTDIDAYYFAGSLPGAILATAADAKTKEMQADAVLLRPITAKSVTPEMFAMQTGLWRAIDELPATKAKTLVEKIEGVFPEVKPFVDLQYPSAVRGADADGSKAKTLLKRVVTLTVRDAPDIEKWQSAMAGL